MVTEFFFRPVELMLNHGLQQSLSAAAIAKELEGRTLALRIEGTPLDLRIGIAGGRFRVTGPGSEAADAAIAGTLFGLGRLLGDDPQAAIRDGAVRMSGDAEIAGAFRDLLHFTRPDLEEELSRLVGDPIAHEAGNVARAFTAWSERAAQSLTRSVGEYLTEESQLLVTRAEFDEFARQVDELVDSVARAEARVRSLAPGRGRG